MTRYVALLRGINIGKVRVAMPELRRLFADLGHDDAVTHLQTGNVVFSSAESDPTVLAADIERRLAADLGVSVPVLIRSGSELAAVQAGNPYPARGCDTTKLLVTFLSGVPAAELAQRLVRPVGESTEFTLAGREIYLHCPDGYGQTKLNNNHLERRLGVVATTRNWRTVTALHELATGA